MNFIEQNIKKGKLISVFYDNDKQKSGIVTDVSPRQLTITYYDTQIDQLERTVIFAEDYESGKIKQITTLTSIKIKKKDEERTSKPSFEITEERVKEGLGKYSVAQLINIFEDHNEDTLAAVAFLLTTDKKFEFLYKLSVDREIKLFDNVNELEKARKVSNETLRTIHNQLERLVSTENNSYNGAEQNAPDTAKILEEAMKRLTGKDGGIGGLGDIFGGGTGPFGGGNGGFGGFGGLGNLGDIFKEISKNQPNGNNNNNQQPNPNDLINDLTKLINDMFNGNGPKR